MCYANPGPNSPIGVGVTEVPKRNNGQKQRAKTPLGLGRVYLATRGTKISLPKTGNAKRGRGVMR